MVDADITHGAFGPIRLAWVGHLTRGSMEHPFFAGLQEFHIPEVT